MDTGKVIASALRKLEYGVYVVSMGKGTAGNAFTASWISQVSSEPPMISLAVHNKHQSSRLIDSHGAFVVNIIAQNHAEVAKTYYGPAESGYEKLKDSTVQESPATGTAMLQGVDGFLDCKVVNTVIVGNHTLFLAEVVAAEIQSDTQILTSSSSKLHYAG
jgi:flavin reductase (DIM6/NTAB) family NADH-FMN oxidoreductase RutF